MQLKKYIAGYDIEKDNFKVIELARDPGENWKRTGDVMELDAREWRKLKINLDQAGHPVENPAGKPIYRGELT